MVPQLLTIDQPENETRQQKRDRERRYQKALKKLKKLVAGVNLPVTFDNTTVTQFGNFGSEVGYNPRYRANHTKSR